MSYDFRDLNMVCVDEIDNLDEMIATILFSTVLIRFGSQRKFRAFPKF